MYKHVTFDNDMKNTANEDQRTITRRNNTENHNDIQCGNTYTSLYQTGDKQKTGRMRQHAAKIVPIENKDTKSSILSEHILTANESTLITSSADRDLNSRFDALMKQYSTLQSKHSDYASQIANYRVECQQRNKKIASQQLMLTNYKVKVKTLEEQVAVTLEPVSYCYT